MYSKIAINNVKKSFKDYTIYFLTLTIAVYIFYSFNSIATQKAVLEAGSTYKGYEEGLESILSVVSIFVSIILACLIIYANNFLIKKRKKELGIYMTLGMPRLKISNILVLETMFVGLISLIVGLLLGIGASQGLSLLIAKLFDISVNSYQFILSISAIEKTCLYFSIIFLIVMISNTRVISKYKLIDMLTAQRKNESIKLKNKVVAIVIFILSILIILFAYWLVNKIGFRPDQKLFWISAIIGAIGTALCFFSVSGFLLLVIQKNKKAYFKNLNIFIIRQINNKINTNFMAMTIICLMLGLTITILSTGISYKESVEAGVEKNTPFDMTIYGVNSKNDTTLKEEVEKLNFKFSEVGKYAYFNKYVVESDLNSELIESGLNKGEEGFFQQVGDGINAIGISDFNNIRKLQGKTPIKLGENEILIASYRESLQDTLNKFIDEKKEFKVDNQIYKIQREGLYKDAYETSEIGSILTLILPDKAIVNAKLEGYCLNINFDTENKIESSQKCKELLNNLIEKNRKEKNISIRENTKEHVIANSKELTGLMVFIAMYLGVIFLIASAAVLALQQLSEASDSKDRYKSLRKIGAPEKMINKAIFIQILIYFMAPLSIALVHSIVAIHVMKGFVMLFGEANILISSLITIFVLLIIYGGYFYTTYLGSKNLANEK